MLRFADLTLSAPTPSMFAPMLQSTESAPAFGQLGPCKIRQHRPPSTNYTSVYIYSKARFDQYVAATRTHSIFLPATLWAADS